MNPGDVQDADGHWWAFGFKPGIRVAGRSYSPDHLIRVDTGETAKTITVERTELVRLFARPSSRARG